MVKSYKKGEDVQLSEHFHLREFDCHCKYPDCGETLVSFEHLANLEELRKITGEITIDDGFRCPKHNADVGGVPGSQHPKGLATDIKTELGPQKTALVANQVEGFRNGGIGLYRTFVHLDSRGYRARWNG